MVQTEKLCNFNINKKDAKTLKHIAKQFYPYDAVDALKQGGVGTHPLCSTMNVKNTHIKTLTIIDRRPKTNEFPFLNLHELQQLERLTIYFNDPIKLTLPSNLKQLDLLGSNIQTPIIMHDRFEAKKLEALHLSCLNHPGTIIKHMIHPPYSNLVEIHINNTGLCQKTQQMDTEIPHQLDQFAPNLKEFACDQCKFTNKPILPSTAKEYHV